MGNVTISARGTGGITALNVQGVGTWLPLPGTAPGVVVVGPIPKGTYTFTITTLRGDVARNLTVACTNGNQILL